MTGNEIAGPRELGRCIYCGVQLQPGEPVVLVINIGRPDGCGMGHSSCKPIPDAVLEEIVG